MKWKDRFRLILALPIIALSIIVAHLIVAYERVTGNSVNLTKPKN